MKKFILLTSSICIILCFYFLHFDNSNTNVIAANNDDTDDISLMSNTSNDLDNYNESLTYNDYLELYKDKIYPNEEINVDLLNYETEDMEVEINQNTINTSDSGSITWKINVEVAGMYNIQVKYFPLEGTSANIERIIYVNGQVPFEGANLITFYRTWVDDGVIENINNTEVRPQKVEEFTWREVYLSDTRTLTSSSYKFYFEQGINTLTFESIREPMKIGSIKLKQEPLLKSYDEYIKKYDDQPIYQGNSIVYQAERIEDDLTTNIKTSSPMVYAIATYTDPKTIPYHPYYTRLNVIGGTNWRVLGDWIEWEVNVPQSGLYQLTFRANQNANRGLFSSRELTINGEVPFEEVKNIAFNYSSNLQQYTLGDGKEDYLFYFEEGLNTIGMRVVYGELGPIVETVEQSVNQLNDIYRQIIQYTGLNPDTYIDYQLTYRIPGLKEMFEEQKVILNDVIDNLIDLAGSKGEDAAIIEKMVFLLDELVKDPESVANKLTLYNSNVTAIGSWLLSVSEQSLNIDYFVLHGENSELPENDTNFFVKLWYGILRFFASFFIDTAELVSSYDNEIVDEITVWIPTSRDQATIIRELIDNSFTPETGIAVNLQLVPKTVLLPATVAGKSPDAVIQVGQDMLDGANVGSNGLPVNFAMRNASVNLAELSGFDEISTQFYDSAFNPVKFNGGVYGLPETQDFLMMFYRKDILDKLGLEIPKTWDDVYNMVSILQINNYEFYLQPSIQLYSTLLYQRGGDLYSGEGLDYGIESGLESEIAVDAFKQYTSFYTNYSFTLSANFVNRFRSGEMPIGIANYISVYNTLSVFAPEIKGQWAMAPIPGIENSDGTINNTTVSDGLYSIMLKNSQKKESTWEFMKWWVSKETQVNYGRKLEGVLGAAGRYSTANKYALQELGWTKTQLDSLESQLENVVGYPEVPGGYMTIRQVGYAFYAVINDGIEPRESLYLYIPEINKEITKKRKEFDLSYK